MKLLSPINSFDNPKKLIKLGAQEFYCGIIPSVWKTKYSAIDINRRNWINSNFSDFNSLSKVIKISHSFDVPVYLTLNSSYYDPKMYTLLSKIVPKAIKIGIDAFIVADIGLLLYLNNKNIKTKTCISTGAAVLNSNSIDFYKKLGAKRIVLPRHLTLEEIKDIRRKNQDIELESFVFNTGCKNIDGLCGFFHGTEKEYYKEHMPCRFEYKSKVLFEDNIQNKRAERTIKSRINYAYNHLKMNCGACALFDFNKVGIDSVKIIGRENFSQKKIKDIIFFNTLLKLLKTGITKQEFITNAKGLYQQTYHNLCKPQLCYYPEI